MTPQITKVEGISKDTVIYRGAQLPTFKEGKAPGHTVFRAKFNSVSGWYAADHGIVCICTMPIKDEWKSFKVISVPKAGFYCHVEPVYE